MLGLCVTISVFVPLSRHGAELGLETPAPVVVLLGADDVAGIERIGVRRVGMRAAVAEHDHVSAAAKHLQKLSQPAATGETYKAPSIAPPSAAMTTTSHAGAFHKASSANATSASAKSAVVLMALVHTG